VSSRGETPTATLVRLAVFGQAPSAVAKGRPRSRHGQITLRLAKVLSQRGDEAVALTRNPDQADEGRRVGAEPVVADLEHPSEGEVAQAIAGCDAVVFATGAGPRSGPGRRRACPPFRSAMTRPVSTTAPQDDQEELIIPGLLGVVHERGSGPYL
jgi:hypothetical protein